MANPLLLLVSLRIVGRHLSLRVAILPRIGNIPVGRWGILLRNGRSTTGHGEGIVGHVSCGAVANGSRLLHLALLSVLGGTLFTKKNTQTRFVGSGSIDRNIDIIKFF